MGFERRGCCNGVTVRLREDHDELLKLVSVFRDMISQPERPAGIDMVKFRTAFAKQLLAHLTREDWLLYPSLLQTSDRVIVATAQSFIDEMGGLLTEFKAWSASWPTERITSDWATFGNETSDLLDSLTRRVVRENEELYPLVEVAFTKAA